MNTLFTTPQMWQMIRQTFGSHRPPFSLERSVNLFSGSQRRKRWPFLRRLRLIQRDCGEGAATCFSTQFGIFLISPPPPQRCAHSGLVMHLFARAQTFTGLFSTRTLVGPLSQKTHTHTQIKSDVYISLWRFVLWTASQAK